jgi:hypothetical protein
LEDFGADICTRQTQKWWLGQINDNSCFSDNCKAKQMGMKPNTIMATPNPKNAAEAQNKCCHPKNNGWKQSKNPFSFAHATLRSAPHQPHQKFVDTPLFIERPG